ncbi:hypothetical protein CMEL01_03349 [Colletotrichum melonis]|uniref:Ankyrin repeat protein n=1 Tax=Colletotrichum melonis TaxID=1209925 RepID=A0AAI9UPC0_9PEZI|nr:hypothetical protein CMEL01_03349 [Colletotrichum melonis]
MNTMSCEGDMRSLLMALTVNPAERRRTQNRLAKRKSRAKGKSAAAAASATSHVASSSTATSATTTRRSRSASSSPPTVTASVLTRLYGTIVTRVWANEILQDLTYTAALADPFGSLQTPPHESTQDFGQAAVIFPASELGVSGEAAPRTLQRNAVTDDLDASSYSAGIPHNLNTVEFIEPWTLDASMTLMTPNSRHEDMSDLSTEDILTLGFARPTQGSPLHIAATHGHINVAKTLILHGSDVNAADKAGLAPIHYATQNNQGPMVTMLAEHGADVDFLDPDGCTPLYRAAESGNKAMVERLLRHGAKLS